MNSKLCTISKMEYGLWNYGQVESEIYEQVELEIMDTCTILRIWKFELTEF